MWIISRHRNFTILIRISKSSMAKSKFAPILWQTYKWGKICDNSAVLLTDNSLASPHFSFRCHFLQQEWIAGLRVFSSKSMAGLSHLRYTTFWWQHLTVFKRMKQSRQDDAMPLYAYLPNHPPQSFCFVL